MREFVMTKKRFQEQYDRLVKLSQESADLNDGKENKESQVFRAYALQTKRGKAFYEYMKDEQLVEVLRTTAMKLNHSPAQREVFWVWRDYIKRRFGKWPYALEAAGLSKAAGAGGKTLEQTQAEMQEYQMLLQRVREKAEDLCRIPHPQEVSDLCERLKDFSDSWNDIIRDAGLNPEFFQEKSVYKIENPEPEYQEILEEILELAKHMGRPPLKSEIDRDIRKKIIAKCGSWRNVLYQIGLEPAVKINPFSATRLSAIEREKERNHKIKLQDCCYRVLNPDEQTMEDLNALKEIKEMLKRIPNKKEVPEELRKRLQRSCGSWANALYQLRYTDGERDD